MSISEIAAEYGVSVKTAQRRMASYTATVKPHPIHGVPTRYYLKRDVKQAMKAR